MKWIQRLKTLAHVRKYKDYLRIRIGGLRIFITTKHLRFQKDNSQSWRKWKRRTKNALLEKNNSCCEICKNAYTRDHLTIHHILPRWSHPELAREESNLMLLCHRCHISLHEAESSRYKLHRLEGE